MAETPDVDRRAGDGIHNGVITFFGEQFQLPERTGGLARMRFADLAQQDEITDMEELAAIYSLLESVIAEADWARFQRHAMKVRATTDELIELVGQIMVAVAARPTQRSSDSSDGPSTAAPSSTSTPAERAIARLSGRPDLQNVVHMTSQARAS